jgi:hypothetical protein
VLPAAKTADSGSVGPWKECVYKHPDAPNGVDKRDAERYRYLVNADPDAGPHVVVDRQDSWGNWRHDVITGVVLDEEIDKRLHATGGRT